MIVEVCPITAMAVFGNSRFSYGEERKTAAR